VFFLEINTIKIIIINHVYSLFYLFKKLTPDALLLILKNRRYIIIMYMKGLGGYNIDILGSMNNLY